MTVQSLFLYYCTGHYTIRDEVMSKQLYTLEFPVRCSPSILYEFLSTPAGLAEWFADKADERISGQRTLSPAGQLMPYSSSFTNEK